MLHNSTYRRELLKEMNRQPLVVARREVHRNVGRRGEVKVGAGDVALEGEWGVVAGRAGKAAELVAADARDFLARMGVKVGEGAGAGNRVMFEVGSCARGFRTVVEPGRVEVHGADAGALWAGWVWLENQMRAAGGPVLPRGEVVRVPAWDLQIAPPTWGANYAVPDLTPEFLSDETFRSLAHAGADGMFVYGDWVLYARGTKFGEVEHPEAEKHIKALKEAAGRAAGYGVKLYFVLVSPKLLADHALFKRVPSARGALLRQVPSTGAIHCLCASDPAALAFHAEVVGGLFREVPELGGVVCIIGGESYYHCFMRSAGSAVGETNCPQCKGKVAEEVIANFLDVTARAVRAQAPGARVMAWPYSAQYFWSKERDQLELIDRLSEGVGLLSEIDKEQVLSRRGYQKVLWDYSVEYDGHSDRIVNQGVRCRQRGRELYVKTETAHGIELLHMPYVPCIGRSARRWQSIRALRPAGVLQRWGFVGMFDSAAERVGYLARWDGGYSAEGAALAVARQLVGDLGPRLAEAWGRFDDAVTYIPSLVSGEYYKGPLFLGPGCPLPVWEGKTPEAFLGNFYYLAEGEATGSDARLKVKDDFTVKSVGEMGVPGIGIQEAEYGRARDLAGEGYEMLRTTDVAGMDPVTREEVAEQVAIGEYLYRTLRACANLVKFLRLREGKVAKAELVAVARDELENAVAAKGLYERAPWLNHSLRIDVGAPESVGMCAEKIRLLEAYVKT